MILFLNFAPLAFGGGAERWIVDITTFLQKNEKVKLIEVNKDITNLYSQAVLKRKFDSRLTHDQIDNLDLETISLASLIPYSSAWKKINNEMNKARLIYTKFEVNEICLLLYFGGLSILRKTIAGFHSPLFYDHKHLTFFEKLHNTIYLSKLSGWFLHQFKTIHVLTDQQEKLLITKFSLKNVVKIPNYVSISREVKKRLKEKTLNIGFLGELTWRKGVDILVTVIEGSPSNFNFTIIGDGPGKEMINNIRGKNISYMGYLEHSEVMKALEMLDVLLLPSRAESFSLASLEAMSLGTLVLSSSFSTPTNIKDAVLGNKTNSPKEYLALLHSAYEMKLSGKLERKSLEIQKIIKDRFSKEVITKQLGNKIFQLSS
jgi:glycosyltransferase involved in cell wall biosynthesis